MLIDLPYTEQQNQSGLVGSSQDAGFQSALPADSKSSQLSGGWPDFNIVWKRA
jgi:hypothetical protein